MAWITESKFENVSAFRDGDGLQVITYGGATTGYVGPDFVELSYWDGVESGHETIYAADPDFFLKLNYALEACITYYNRRWIAKLINN